MTPHDEQRLTAYALGELPEGDRPAIEALLRDDPAARAYVDELLATAGRVRAALMAEHVPSLSEGDRNMILKPYRAPATPLRLRIVRRLAIAACVALAAVLAVALFMPSLGAARRTTRQTPGNPPTPMGMAPSSVSSLGDKPLIGSIASNGNYTWAMEGRADNDYRFGQSAGVYVLESKGIHQSPPQGDLFVFVPHEELLERRVPPHAREAYDRINDNPFLPALDNPLSTFSVDVDTASYANVRRFLLAEHRLPPPDAVRIEELINYFDYDYTASVDNAAPFAAHVEVASAPWNPQHRLVRIGLKGYEVGLGQRGPANLVFLLDVSGSMDEPNKLPLVKAGMKRLVGQLRGDDRVAIAVYAGASGLALESTRVDDGKAKILDAIDALSPGGSTNGAAGIELAYQQAAANFREDGVNRVILCTDGDFNVGITDRGQLTRLIEEKAKSRVYLSVLGFGTGNLQDATMEELSRKGDGNYAYIDSIREAEKVLVEQAGGTLVTIAKDVKLQIEFNPAKVQAYRLIGYENRLLTKEDFADDLKDAGDIGSGHAVTALYEVVPVPSKPLGRFEPPPNPLKYQREATLRPEAQVSSELLTLKLRYKAPDAAKEVGASRLVEFPVSDDDRAFTEATDDFRFAAAVAGFGMILRDSPHKGTATLDAIAEIARDARGEDRGGYRAEFIELVRKAQALSGSR